MAHVKQKNSGLWVPQSTHEKIDSQKMFIENMEQHEANHTELIERIHGKVDSIVRLKALDVSSADSTIKSGTIVVVDGIGPYYYTLLSEEEADDEEIVAPNTGEGLWILSGGGGNLIVDEVDYGEDTDSDQGGLVLKIKKLFNKKTKTNFFPITTTKAVRDTTTNKTLFDILRFAPTIDESEEVVEESLRDSDTLGGQLPSYYATAQGLFNISDSISSEYDESVTYTVGQFCTRNNKLYECVTETSGEFTVDDWAETTVENLVISANNSIVDLEDRLEETNSNLIGLLKSENFTVYGTSGTYISKNVDVTLDGYTLLGVIGSSGSTVTMIVKSSIIAENLITVQAYDNGASMDSAVVTVTCLYMKKFITH